MSIKILLYYNQILENNYEHMVNKIIFFDINKNIVNTMKRKIIMPNIECISGDVRQILTNYKVNFLISPANSMGYMDGGIDAIYSKIFPGIQDRVMSTIKTYNIKSTLLEIESSYVLPIGSALMVDITSNKYPNCEKLICCPTMEYPRDISDRPEIIYYAMCAILNLCSNYTDKIIAIPGLGTATGRIDADTMCRQINRAYSEYKQLSITYSHLIYQDDHKAFIVKRDLA